MSAKSVYIFVGPPGSGKGTLSHLCVKTLGWVQLSTGNLCRKHIADETEIGKQIDFALKSGKLVSDDLINAMVYDWFQEAFQNSDSIILDGYPRTVKQAQALQSFLKEKLSHVKAHVIHFSVSDDLVINRICGRLICQNKNCQEVYSLNPDARVPINAMRCDICLNPLGRRNDDALEAVQDRLATYHKHAYDLLNYYAEVPFATKQLVADKKLEEVFEEFKQLVGLTHS